MNQNYWRGRWERGETGWHQQEIEPALIRYFSSLKPCRVLVPLCGKSLDLLWLTQQGHQVVGVELSTLACEAFFSENKIPSQRSAMDTLTVFEGGDITLFNADFFEIKSQHVGKFSAIYDRAALIALPPDIRLKYASHLLKLIQECNGGKEFHFLQIALEKVPDDRTGPPFSVTKEELNSLYGLNFKVNLLEQEEVTVGSEGKSVRAIESVYRLEQLIKKPVEITGDCEIF